MKLLFEHLAEYIERESKQQVDAEKKGESVITRDLEDLLRDGLDDFETSENCQILLTRRATY